MCSCPFFKSNIVHLLAHMSRGCRIRRQIVVTSFSEFKGETSKQLLLHKFYLPSIICTKDTAGLLHALQIIPWFVFRQSVRSQVLWILRLRHDTEWNRILPKFSCKIPFSAFAQLLVIWHILHICTHLRLRHRSCGLMQAPTFAAHVSASSHHLLFLYVCFSKFNFQLGASSYFYMSAFQIQFSIRCGVHLFMFCKILCTLVHSAKYHIHACFPICWSKIK